MRIAVAAALIAGALAIGASPASAVPLALADHAASSKALSGASVELVARRSAYAKRYARAYRGKRRYDWTYYPYWRPYQYRYWQYYYPYGGPLF